MAQLYNTVIIYGIMSIVHNKVTERMSFVSFYMHYELQ